MDPDLVPLVLLETLGLLDLAQVATLSITLLQAAQLETRALVAPQELRDLMATVAVAHATLAEGRVLEYIKVLAHQQEPTAEVVAVPVYQMQAVRVVAAPEQAMLGVRDLQE